MSRRAAREAHVAISIADDFDPEHDAGQILVLRRDFAWLPALRELIARPRRPRQNRPELDSGPEPVMHRGAFFLGFTSLTAVVITNLGTWADLLRLARTPPEGGWISSIGSQLLALIGYNSFAEIRQSDAEACCKGGRRATPV